MILSLNYLLYQIDWAVVKLAFAEYKTRGPVILKSSDTAELIEKLEDSQMQLGSMATNRYSAPFREEVQSWIVQLSTVSEIVEQWLMVQNMWMYMEVRGRKNRHRMNVLT